MTCITRSLIQSRSCEKINCCKGITCNHWFCWSNYCRDGYPGILGSVIWAFDFAMSGLFFPLVLGVWWKRANGPGAVAGMLLGLGSGMAYLIWVRNGGSGFWGITQLTFGIVGALVSLVSMVVVSLLTAAPDKATQEMIDELRIPSGKTILGKQH